MQGKGRGASIAQTRALPVDASNGQLNEPRQEHAVCFTTDTEFYTIRRITSHTEERAMFSLKTAGSGPHPGLGGCCPKGCDQAGAPETPAGGTRAQTRPESSVTQLLGHLT